MEPSHLRRLFVMFTFKTDGLEDPKLRFVKKTFMP